MSLNNQQLPIMKKILILIVIILVAFIILILSVSNTINKNRDLPSLMSTKKDLAVRGNIYSSDNFKIGTSRKIFSASIDTRCLAPDKKELFITLFSIYSDIPKDTIRKKIANKSGHTIISRKINQRVAKELKSLAFKLRRLDVFRAIKINGRTILHGLSIYETGEERIYPYKDTLAPVIGFMKTANSDGKQRVNGISGLEKKFNSHLNNLQDGVLQGQKDILSYIIFNKDSKIIKRKDGDDIHLSIPLKLQRNIELMLDRYKKEFEAKEIMVSVMESDTGKILTLASSNRFDPANIKKDEIENLPINPIEYNFEPGSVIKPISISLAMDKGLVKENELFFAYNNYKGRNSKGEYPKGKYKIGRHTIKDDHLFKKNYLTLEDVVIFSSNIGTLIIANRLSGLDFYNGYKEFGLSVKTGIDLPHEKRGVIHKVYQYQAGESQGKDNIYKATDSYGQGITTTFMQVLKAYSAFNNDGKLVTPYIVETREKVPQKRVLTSKTANEMKELLVKTVTKGTGKKAIIEGLEVGGKTGTANVAKNGRYQRQYMSSFFGFVNDGNKKYTIGVTVNDPVNTGPKWYYYYASNSAVPVFKEIVKTLVKLNYLTPKESKN